MNNQVPQVFGPRFVVDQVEDLELLTDLLATSRDHLNVVFAVASYLEQVPNGSSNFKPLLQKRMRNSVEQLSSVAASTRPSSS